MARYLFAVLAVFVLATTATAADRSSSGSRQGSQPAVEAIEGVWRGWYHYPNDSQPRVPFELSVTATNRNAFEASLREPNTFGDASSQELFADATGVVAPDGVVSFTKTYDGSGGVSHSVNYNGRLSADGQEVIGSWSIPGSGTGRFEMRRIR